MRAPFPWYGGKSRAAPIIWRAFGNVPNYVEPFAGSMAVLLARPHEAKVETVNDLDGLIANFWRATKLAPDHVALWADWPVNEADLHARHQWLTDRANTLYEQLVADPEYFDAQVAGWWVWGVCSWIGNGWCSRDERLHRCLPKIATPGHGIHAPTRVRPRKPRTGLSGQGIHSFRVTRKKPQPHNKGVNRYVSADALVEVFTELRDRLRHVRICCGDWSRVLGRSTLGIDTNHGMSPCGVFFDPPYSHAAGREQRLYREDSADLSHRVREWAIEHGDNPALRIALCGWDGEHEMPAGWRCEAWKPQNGFANRARERIWLSPHCLEVEVQPSLFDKGPA